MFRNTLEKCVLRILSSVQRNRMSGISLWSSCLHDAVQGCSASVWKYVHRGSLQGSICLKSQLGIIYPKMRMIYTQVRIFYPRTFHKCEHFY